MKVFNTRYAQSAEELAKMTKECNHYFIPYQNWMEESFKADFSTYDITKCTGWKGVLDCKCGKILGYYSLFGSMCTCLYMVSAPYTFKIDKTCVDLNHFDLTEKINDYDIVGNRIGPHRLNV